MTMTPLFVGFGVAALLVMAIGAGAQPLAGPPPGVPAQEPGSPALGRLMTQGEIYVVEEHLKDFGFDPGPVDGHFTAQTRAAVRAFQARYGLPVSGLLDRATRRELVPGLDPERRL
jgi:peptidoglycan hydrolase-like protein with peptidoglycan-binding domain